jgi:hypothetical protein
MSSEYEKKIKIEPFTLMKVGSDGYITDEKFVRDYRGNTAPQTSIITTPEKSIKLFKGEEVEDEDIVRQIEDRAKITHQIEKQMEEQAEAAKEIIKNFERILRDNKIKL